MLFILIFLPLHQHDISDVLPLGLKRRKSLCFLWLGLLSCLLDQLLGLRNRLHLERFPASPSIILVMFLDLLHKLRRLDHNRPTLILFSSLLMAWNSLNGDSLCCSHPKLFDIQDRRKKLNQNDQPSTQLLVLQLNIEIIALHRMFRAIPTNNKLCFDKQLKRSWKIHEDKLRTIRSSINKSPPQHFHFLDQRAKRSALDQVRHMEIEKENHSLLSKIKSIGEKGSKTSYLKETSNTCDKKKTLNEGFRKKELVKIVEENQEIIKRIHEKKSMYNVRKWEKERKNIEKNINLISSFPYKNYPTTQTRVNLWMENDPDRSVKIENLSLSKSRLKKQDLIFSGTHKIGESYYLIETNLHDKNFVIEIENLENMSEKYRLQMSQTSAFRMLEKNFSGDIQNLFNSLEIDETKGTCELKCFAPSQQSCLKQRKNMHSP